MLVFPFRFMDGEMVIGAQRTPIVNPIATVLKVQSSVLLVRKQENRVTPTVVVCLDPVAVAMFACQTQSYSRPLAEGVFGEPNVFLVDATGYGDLQRVRNAWYREAVAMSTRTAFRVFALDLSMASAYKPTAAKT